MRHLCLVLILYVPMLALAAGQNWENSRREAEQLLRQSLAGQPVVVRWDKADPPLLPACSQPDIQWPANLRGKQFVTVSCRTGQRWSARLPVWVSMVGPVAFTREALGREHALRPEDMEWRSVELASYPEDVVTSAEQASGRMLRQPLTAGQALRQSQLRSPLIIVRQQQVRLRVVSQNFVISSEGVAQNDAASGERVRVRTSGGQVVEGVAREGGVVEITP